MLTTPDLSDKNDDAKVIELSFQHYGNIKSFYGQIETAVCPDDNSYVKEILEAVSYTHLTLPTTPYV